MSAKLEKWSVRWSDEPFRAPEIRNKTVVGTVFGSDKFPDGTNLALGLIVEANGKTVKTSDGLTFDLGEPEPEYLAFLRENDIPFNAENPIDFVEKYRYLAGA
jgi:hypothetical protein